MVMRNYYLTTGLLGSGNSLGELVTDTVVAKKGLRGEGYKQREREKRERKRENEREK